MQLKTPQQDKDVSILLMLPTAILGMIGCIEVLTANKSDTLEEKSFSRHQHTVND